MIYLGADHGGYELKEQVKQWLEEWEYTYEDCGAYELDPADDYPKFAFAVGEKVADSQGDPLRMGVIACRSAAGIVMAVNKVKEVRAFAAFTVESARHAREHNNANVIALSGDWLESKKAKEILRTFLKTEFSNEDRHRRRVEQIIAYESR